MSGPTDTLASSIPTFPRSLSPTSYSPPASPLEGDVVIPCEFCGIALEEAVVFHHQVCNTVEFKILGLQPESIDDCFLQLLAVCVLMLGLFILGLVNVFNSMSLFFFLMFSMLMARTNVTCVLRRPAHSTIWLKRWSENHRALLAMLWVALLQTFPGELSTKVMCTRYWYIFNKKQNSN